MPRTEGREGFSERRLSGRLGGFGRQPPPQHRTRTNSTWSYGGAGGEMTALAAIPRLPAFRLRLELAPPSRSFGHGPQGLAPYTPEP